MKRAGIYIVLIAFFQFVEMEGVFSQEDRTHFSNVFGRERPYRVFLPDGYATSQGKYPVIYYFHGNTGSHELSIPGVDKLVDENKVILVASNGRSQDSDIRPYNIGNHSNINYNEQFKDYFLELAKHIDSSFNTISERSGRAVIGHSMGGIMSFFLAAKYPDMIGAAVNIKGSPEFFIGYPDNHTLYSVRYFFKYMNGVNSRFHNSTIGELVYLNNEVNKGALREEALNYDYQIYEGGHGMASDEFEDAFNYVIHAFHNPASDPIRWHHTDIYPNFRIWGYEVKSNKTEPGFIDMRGVTKGGLCIGTMKWQPGGENIPGVNIQVQTPEIYEPNSEYFFLDYNLSNGNNTVSKIKSDADGKIKFNTNHQNHQIGIYRQNDPAEIVFLVHEVNENDIFLNHNSESQLKIQLLNRGGSSVNNLQVRLSTSQPGVEIDSEKILVKDIKSGEATWLTEDFNVTAANKPVADGSPFKVRFNLDFTDDKGHKWQDEFDAPVFYDVPEFTNIGIDDGDTEIFGSGNGNNTAEPGETVMFYEITGISKRLRVYYDDPYLNERLFDEMQPDKWGDGYTLSSLVRIADNCPIGHKIKFLASYEIKDWKAIKRNVTWGTFAITVGDENDH